MTQAIPNRGAFGKLRKVYTFPLTVTGGQDRANQVYAGGSDPTLDPSGQYLGVVVPGGTAGVATDSQVIPSCHVRADGRMVISAASGTSAYSATGTVLIRVVQL